MNNRHVGGGGGGGRGDEDGGTIRAWRIYAQSQRQRTTTTLEDRESRSRQTDSASPPGCIPFPLSLSPSACLPLPICQSQSPFVCCAAHLGLLCPRFPFPFLCLLRFALLCFVLLPCLLSPLQPSSLDTLLTRPAAWRSFVQTVL